MQPGRIGALLPQGCVLFTLRFKFPGIASIMMISNCLPTTADILIACANSGIFPKESFSPQVIEESSFAALLRDRFEKRAYRVRHPVRGDLSGLVALEAACWPDPLRAPAEALRDRIERFPSGHCVMEMGGRLVGAIYSQRIAAVETLKRVDCTTAAALHREDGPTAQLLAVNVLPEVQNLGLGDQLLEFMLQYCSVREGIERIVAVSLCKQYHRHAAIPMEAYIRARDEAGFLKDPVLRFHEAHGGRISGLCPAYRPRDLDNRGNGVLVEYAILNRRAAMPGRTEAFAAGAQPRDGWQGPVLPLVEACVRRVLGEDKSQLYASSRPLMEMGFDSLKLMTLRALLGKRLGRELDSAFFFRYSTPERIARFFDEGEPGEEEAIRVEPPWATEAAPAPPGAPEIQAAGAGPACAGEAVAVVGMACRFPGGSDNPADFWRLLVEGADAVTEIPADRWDKDRYYDPDPQTSGRTVSRHGGFIRHVNRFDAGFFNISPREAAAMDPQQRLLLTVAWEALEQAGINPATLSGTRTGVFAGLFSHDYETLQLKGGDRQAGPSFDDAYFATGNSAAVAAGRIAYFLGLEGPALTIDTACSSSLVAVHLACRSLRSGESDLALAAGVNLILSPELSMAFSRAGMLSPTGRCRAFDAAADGYVRAEGCAVVVLKPLARALADRDPVLAVLRGSAINQDGASNGLTAPNGLAQEAVIRAALADAGVAPHQVSYIEAHGTGTRLGDPVEVSSLANVYKTGRSADHPLFIGSVKGNIGHAEAAAGIAGLIKAVLALRHRHIPRQVHFRQLNGLISLDQIPAAIPAAGADWPAQAPGSRRLAAVSSFGFSGTNAHVVVEEAPDTAPRRPNAPERPLHILTLSARSEAALQGLTDKYASFLASPAAQERLADICHTANAGRAHFGHRIAMVGASAAQLGDELRSAEGSQTQGVFRGGCAALPRVAFLFTGQGAQFAGMGSALYNTQPTFRRALDRCAELLRTALDRPLLDVIYPSQKSARTLVDQTACTQPALFAIEYALCCLWKSWGVQPEAVIGHSVGEYAAACAAGVFSLEDGLKLIAARGTLMQALPPNGAMAAVFAEEKRVRQAIAAFADEVSMAAHNGPRLVVISGLATSLAQVTHTLEAQGIKVAMLNVSHAFHSPLMEPVLEPFGRIARQIHYAPPQIELISNLTGEAIAGEIASPDYWVRHIRAAVRFADGIRALHRNGYRVFVEIGPHPVLAGMAKMCLPDQDSEDPCIWLPSLLRGRPDWEQMLASLGALYARGVRIDWPGFDADYTRRKMALPTYAFEGRRYWAETARVGAEKSPPAGPAPETRVGQAEETQSDLLYRLQWRKQALGRPSRSGRRPDPAAVRERIAPLADHAFPDLLAEMEALCAAYVQEAMLRMGWDFALGRRFSTDEAAVALRVAAPYKPLLGRLLGMMAEEGILHRAAQGWQVLQACRVHGAEQRRQTLLAGYPRAEAELTLLGRCAADLAGVLRGERDPLGLVFPEGDLSTAVRLYEDSPTFGAMNRMVAQALSAMLADRPGGRKLRILEIGAGTGGTTAAVLPHLTAEQAEYIFTDVSAHFLAKGRQRFAACPFIRYQRLDIAKDPLAQGFRPHEVDIVLAANVLHATADLRHTLDQVGQLLSPGGMLVLLEGIERRRWLDMIFGLLDGWWMFTDHDIRPDHPLMGTTAWQNLLRDRGFGETAVLAPGHGQALFEQALILAQKDPAAQPDAVPDARHWLVCTDAGGVGTALSALLSARGDIVTRVAQAERFAMTPDGAYTVDPQARDDFRRLVGRVCRGKPALHGIIHLWGLDAPEPCTGADQDVSTASVRLCMGMLHMVQALVETGAAALPALWQVTRHAVCVDGTEGLSAGLSQAPLWGLAQVIAAEHPELNCVRIDMHHGSGCVAALFDEVVNGRSADRIALRANARYAAQLAPLAADRAAAPAPPVIHADGAYLISGGLGGLGLQVAGHLAARGAGQLILLGRSGTPSAGTPAAQAIRKLEQAGAEVVVARADVSRRDDVAAVLQRVAASAKPLKGIVHAAGVFEDRLLVDHARAFFESVFAAKVAGAWNLHELTRDISLDFFVLFSSATAFVCSSGLGNYAAANAFLDALAHYRRSIGLTGLSIAWGPWRATGMAGAVGRRRKTQWAAQGFDMLPPATALSIFQRLLGAAEPQVTAMAMDWPRFFGWQADHARAAVFDRIAQRTRAHGTQRQDFYGQLKAAPKNRQPELLREHLRDMVAGVLGLESSAAVDSHLGLFQMGMDSLTAMELRNRLQKEFACTLAATLIFKYPTVASLADFLQDTIVGPADAPIPDAPGENRQTANAGIETAEEAIIHAAAGEMTDEQAEALLLERLDTLRY